MESTSMPRLLNINAKTNIEETHEQIDKLILNITICDGFAGCVRERERYQTNTKNETEIHFKNNEKSMQNLGSKKGCKHVETNTKMDPKGGAKMMKHIETWIPKNDAEI